METVGEEVSHHSSYLLNLALREGYPHPLVGFQHFDLEKMGPTPRPRVLKAQFIFDICDDSGI